MSNIIFKNKEANLAAHVTSESNGGFRVALEATDAGAFYSITAIFDSEEKAIEYANGLVGIPTMTPPKNDYTAEQLDDMDAANVWDGLMNGPTVENCAVQSKIWLSRQA